MADLKHTTAGAMYQLRLLIAEWLLGVILDLMPNDSDEKIFFAKLVTTYYEMVKWK